jgi:CshA-type fibril repeat protein
VAVDDAVTATEDTPLVIAVTGNDTDADGPGSGGDVDPSTVTVVGGPAHGTATVDPASGAVTYRPAPDFNGTDTFTYRVCDRSGLCDTATVTVTVRPVADAPVARNDAVSANQDTATAIDVLANDSDSDGDLDAATLRIVTGPGHGRATVDAGGRGTVRYTPDPAYHGPDRFVYEVCDRTGACARATVTITVTGLSDQPTAADDSAISDGSPVTIAVLANDRDPDGDRLRIRSVTEPAHGRVSINPDGTITYTPVEGFRGTDTFSYTIEDADGNLATATVTVRVDPPAQVLPITEIRPEPPGGPQPQPNPNPEPNPAPKPKPKPKPKPGPKKPPKRGGLPGTTAQPPGVAGTTSGRGTVPTTGADAGPLTAAGLVCLVAGFVLRRPRRRRRQRS